MAYIAPRNGLFRLPKRQVLQNSPVLSAVQRLPERLSASISSLSAVLNSEVENVKSSYIGGRRHNQREVQLERFDCTFNIQNTSV